MTMPSLPSFPFDLEEVRRTVFGQNPELAFLGHLDRAGGTRSLQQFFRNRVGDFQRRYQAHVSRQLMEADPETFDPATLTRPEQFFGGLNFQEEFAGYSPEEQGSFPHRFAPKTRFLFR